ncbi:uncharacterized protein LOC120408987 isoform X4 [Mauremys reevesii]|uniref:uncharacterized protein LOC120408987 isoform X4 n=1 Tax=Mauremys reevesii TaxID=260615 RepID=UPI0019400456|nr:uncharacterized protein LOC120408987 isoform X4 [Mauremys reevesii]
MSARRTLFGVFSFSFIDFARQQTSLYRSQSITLVSSPCLLAGQGNASGHHPLQPALGLESEEEGEGHLLTLNIRHPSYHHLQQGPPGIQRRRNGWTCPQMKLLSRSSESSTSVEKRMWVSSSCSCRPSTPRVLLHRREGMTRWGRAAARWLWRRGLWSSLRTFLKTLHPAPSSPTPWLQWATSAP